MNDETDETIEHARTQAGDHTIVLTEPLRRTWAGRFTVVCSCGRQLQSETMVTASYDVALHLQEILKVRP